MINQRVAAVRDQLKRRSLDACVIFGTDPHQSEYVPPRWETRKWVSGFTGSAGTVVITQDHACLWSDFRYYIQAEEQLKGSDFIFFKSGEADTLKPEAWLAANLKQGERVGVNADTISQRGFEDLDVALHAHAIELAGVDDYFDGIWDDRPSIPDTQVSDFSVTYAGKSREDKLTAVRKKMNELGASCHFVSALDEIAWILNIRGRDVKHTPVCLSFLLITGEACKWYVGRHKVPDALAEDLSVAGIEIHEYSGAAADLAALPGDAAVLLDAAKTCHRLDSVIPASCRKVYDTSPIAMMKCLKNDVELRGMASSSLRDCAALVRFLSRLESDVAKGGVTELTVAERLIELRSEDDFFIEPSFPSIAGYNDHGALCHYCADEASSYQLKPEGLFLIDSGGQYKDGTTDITRTVALGPLTAQQKTDFTLVLKSHIQLAMTRFPAGTTGGQLEVLGKHALWTTGRHYNHGPGHGLGVCLGVHEGPAGFGKGNPISLRPGMVLTNEPGLYREGEYGIRIENTVKVVEDCQNEFGTFYAFETISFCPIDTRAIDPSLLTETEVDWLNNYHQTTFEVLSPLVEPSIEPWLNERCRPL